jgi:hypothetical protein
MSRRSRNGWLCLDDIMLQPWYCKACNISGASITALTLAARMSDRILLILSVVVLAVLIAERAVWDAVAAGAVIGVFWIWCWLQRGRK